MNEIVESGNPEKASRPFLGVLAASLSTVALLQWIPLFSFFFSIPLFLLYFLGDKKRVLITIGVTLIINALVSVLMMIFSKITVNSEVLFISLLSSAFFILPLLCLYLPDKIRFRYKIGCAGLLLAVSWTLFFMYTDAGKELTTLLHELSDKTTNILYSMVKEGFERTAFRTEFSPEMLYSILLKTLLFSILPVCISMYAISCKLALSLVRKAQKKIDLPLFKVVTFYNDFVLFLPLIFGMAGIIFGKFFDNFYMTVIYWNLTLGIGLYYVLQGFGIFFFFMHKLRVKTGIHPIIGYIFMLAMFLFNVLPYFLGCLLIVGVVELFVPLRMRFNNIDTIDPTPGRDSDHT